MKHHVLILWIQVIALKQAVDAMSDRMRTVENTLQQDLEPLKQSSQALETVALQLASERDSALKEVPYHMFTKLFVLAHVCERILRICLLGV